MDSQEKIYVGPVSISVSVSERLSKCILELEPIEILMVKRKKNRAFSYPKNIQHTLF